MNWTGTGCDVCGFGSVEDIESFDPEKPCPNCGEVMAPPIMPPGGSAEDQDHG